MRNWLESLLCIGLASSLWALPEGPQVVHGQVQLSQPQSSLMQVLQATPQAILNWHSFQIGSGQAVQFLQPNAQAVLLNRVTGLTPSEIYGQMSANGRIFLVNPNGILFGPNSQVNCGSFLASTLSISDQDFLAGRYQFSHNPSGPSSAVVNQGQLQVDSGGFLVLLGSLVDNQGSIVAHQGQAILGATPTATLSVDATGLLHVTLPQPNSQASTVLLTPAQMSDTLSQVVRSPQLVEAGSIQETPLGFELRAAEGVVLNQGHLEADQILLNSSQATVLSPTSRTESPGGRIEVLSQGATWSGGQVSNPDGFVEISGARALGLYTSPELGATGQLLLDPGILTITQTGGVGPPPPFIANPGDLSVNAAALGGATGTVILEAGDDIVVQDGVHVVFTNPVDVRMQAGRDILMQGSSSLSSSDAASSINFQAGREMRLQDVRFNNVTVNVPGGNSETFLAGQFGRPGAPTQVLVQVPNLGVQTNTTLDFQGTTANISLEPSINFFSRGGSRILLPGGNLTIRAGFQNTILGNMTSAAAQSVNLSAITDAVTVTSVGGRVQATQINVMTPRNAILNNVEAQNLSIQAGGSLGLGNVVLTAGSQPQIPGASANLTANSNSFGMLPGSRLESTGPAQVSYQGGRFDSTAGSIQLGPGSTMNVNTTMNGTTSGAILTGPITVPGGLNFTAAGNVRIFDRLEANQLNLTTQANILGISPQAQVVATDRLQLDAQGIFGNYTDQSLRIRTGTHTPVSVVVRGPNFDGTPLLGTGNSPVGAAGSLFYHSPQSANQQIQGLQGNVRVIREIGTLEPAPPPSPTNVSPSNLSPSQQQQLTQEAIQSMLQLGNLPPILSWSGDSRESLSTINPGLTAFFATSPVSPVVETVVLLPESSDRAVSRKESVASTASENSTPTTSIAKTGTPIVETAVLSPESSGNSGGPDRNQVASATWQVLSLAGEEEEEVRFWRTLIERIVIWEEQP